FSSYISDIQSGICCFSKSHSYEVQTWQLTFQGDFVNGSVMVIFITLVLLPIFIIGNDKQNSRYEILTVMPFKREEIIFTKWLTSVVVIFVSQLSMVVLSVFMFQINKSIVSQYNNVSSILQWFLILFLISVIIITFIMIIQCVCGPIVAGGIIGLISIIIPSVWNTGIYSIQYIFKGSSISAMIFNVDMFFQGILTGYSIIDIDLLQRNHSLLQLFIEALIQILLLLILLILIFKKMKLENVGNLIIFKTAEYILRVCIIISVMFLFAPFGISEGGALGIGLIRMIVNIIISGVLTHFILDKVIKRINK
ncbi:MAG: hypothetical protein Q8936_24385, partial [Bacillota bacterium]|nr:hypothetical protein [Bacillota bacterium]